MAMRGWSSLARIVGEPPYQLALTMAGGVGQIPA